MKGTTEFKAIIKAYLDNSAEIDTLFATAYAKEGKNIDDCIIYILDEVKKSGCSGFADEEIFSMAIHYFYEDDIKVGKPSSAAVVINRSDPRPLKESKPKRVRKNKTESFDPESLL